MYSFFELIFWYFKICETFLFTQMRNLSQVAYVRSHSLKISILCDLFILTKMKTTWTICRKSFAYKSHLVRHIYTQTNEKPFTWTIFGSNIFRKQILWHIFTYANQKPFTCSIYIKSFAMKADLVTFSAPTIEQTLHMYCFL